MRHWCGSNSASSQHISTYLRVIAAHFQWKVGEMRQSSMIRNTNTTNHTRKRLFRKESKHHLNQVSVISKKDEAARFNALSLPSAYQEIRGSKWLDRAG